MKRAISASESQSSKRRKSRQACVSCRKHKTRCETLESKISSFCCHRCKVLAIPCSFGELNGQGHNSSTSPAGGDPYGSTVDERPENTPSGSLGPEGSLGWGGTLSPEDLITSRPAARNTFDWIETPLLAMQELLRKPPQQVTAAPISSIIDVLSQPEIDSLIALFDDRYSAWLHFSTNYLRRHPFLDLVKCTVAARQLGPLRRSSVIPRLNSLVDSYMFKYAFTSSQSMETITALLILSLWPPEPSTAEAAAHDNRMIASSAVSAAMQLSLNQAVANAIHLVQSHPNVRESERELAVNKVRLWLSLVGAEWMLCMGTGRTPTSQRSDLDYGVLDIISPKTLNIGSRDLRLYLLTRMQSLAGKGLAMHVQDGPKQVQTFHDEVVENVLTQLEILYTSIQPLGVTVDYESSHFNMLVLHYHCCRLLVLHHIVCELRRDDARNSPGLPESQRTWYSGLNRANDNASREWGMDGITTAQALLVSFLSHPGSDREFLVTAPDHVFSMVLMAAALVVLAKAHILRYYSRAEKVVLIVSEELLPKVIARLNRIADTSETAQKCAEVVSVLLRDWQTEAQAHKPELLQWQGGGTPEVSGVADTPGGSSSSGDYSSTHHHPMPTPPPGIINSSYSFEHAFTNSMDPGLTQDMLLDADLWNVFAQTTMDTHLPR